MKQYKAALVGYGGMGHWHFEGICKTDRVKFVGVYDIDPKRMELAKSEGFEKLYDSYEAMLADASLDIIVVATPNNTHYEIVKDIIAHGFHIVCDKPVTFTSRESEELKALAGKLDEINATHLDRRIDLPGTQKELKTLAKAINDMLDRVNAAYSAQMQFVSDASHELRTPIAVIQGYAALLDRWGKDDPEARQEAIDAIRSESDAMERLVEQLLFLARGDNDTQPIRPQLMDLTAVAEDVLREEQMIHPERAFLARWQGPVVVRADPGLVKQVMRILMDNSVKYSGPEGRVYLRVSAQKDYARVTVQDEGMGIVPQAIPHIFDRFYRTDSSRARQTGGTGLGLSIARWIVDRHGGWFEVVSREDVGTRITFVLPLEGTA